MDAYNISNAEISELKQTIGFRVSGKKWAEFVEAYPDGCASTELIEFVKTWMNPPYEERDLDKYLEDSLKLFVNFIRG